MNQLLQVLRQSPNWVRYTLEDKDNNPWTSDSQGRQQKVPRTFTGRRAKVNVSATWSPLTDLALTLFDKLGFVLSRECNLLCIDLDAKEYTPAMYDLHRRLLEDFKDCYIEFSPSGKGLHIWCRGTLGNGRSGYRFRQLTVVAPLARTGFSGF
jgi:putative DNA primase/helicase